MNREQENRTRGEQESKKTGTRKRRTGEQAFKKIGEEENRGNEKTGK